MRRPGVRVARARGVSPGICPLLALSMESRTTLSPGSRPRLGIFVTERLPMYLRLNLTCNSARLAAPVARYRVVAPARLALLPAAEELTILPSEACSPARSRGRCWSSSSAATAICRPVVGGTSLRIERPEGRARSKVGVAKPVANGRPRSRPRCGARRPSARRRHRHGSAVRVELPQSRRIGAGQDGCNSAACHGAQAGKNGFKISLFGYDPEGDFLAHHAPGPRTADGAQRSRAQPAVDQADRRDSAQGRRPLRRRFARISRAGRWMPRACPAPQADDPRW